MKPTKTIDTMKKEYDFTAVSGVRGKYHEAYRKGHKVTIQELQLCIILHRKRVLSCWNRM